MFKVAIFLDSRRESGGAYQELLYTIKNIKKYNRKVSEFLIVCSSKKLNLNLEKEGIEIKYLSLSPFDRYVCYLRNFSPFYRRIKKYLFFKNKFENFIKKNKIDLIYFTGPSQYSMYLENTKFFITVPDVSHRENLEFPEIVDESEFVRKDEIFKKSLPRALAIFTNSEIIKDRISFFYNILKERIFIINHQPSSAIDDFKIPDKRKNLEIIKKYHLPKNYIFYPSMYLPHKNHKNLIDSIYILKNKYSLNPQVVFCGSDIGYKKNLEHYVKQKGLSENFYFLDFVEDEHLPYLYLNAYTLIMTSLIGPTNIPPWEAFKMRIPVIYPNLNGIREVLKDAAIYIDPYNPENIAESIKKLFDDKNLRSNLISNGEKRLNEVKNNDEFDQFFKLVEKYKDQISLYKSIE